MPLMPRQVGRDRAHRRSRERSDRIASSVRPLPPSHTTRSSEGRCRTPCSIATRALRESFAPWSPGSARATAAETAAAAESTKTAAATAEASATTKPAASPSTASTSPTAAHRNEDRQTSSDPAPAATQQREEEKEKEEINERRYAASASGLLPLLHRRSRRLKRAVDLKVELARVSLCDARRHQRQAGAVVLLAEERHRFVAEPTRGRVGDKTFRTKSNFGAYVATSVLRRLLRNEENDHARVARGIPGISLFADLPLATDLKRHFFERPAAEIRERDNDDLAARLRAHVGDDALHPTRVLRRDDVREVVDVSTGRRDLQPLERNSDQRRDHQQEAWHDRNLISDGRGERRAGR